MINGNGEGKSAYATFLRVAVMVMLPAVIWIGKETIANIKFRATMTEVMKSQVRITDLPPGWFKKQVETIVGAVKANAHAISEIRSDVKMIKSKLEP